MKLKVALLTHDNRGGGASLAVSRLARGLTLISSNHRIANTLLVSELENRDHQISKLKIATTFNNHSLDILISTLLSRVWSRLHNVQSDPRYFYMSGYKNTSGFLHDYDVINLFWLQKFASLRDLSDLNKPLVITLHDMWFSQVDVLTALNVKSISVVAYPAITLVNHLGEMLLSSIIQECYLENLPRSSLLLDG